MNEMNAEIQRALKMMYERDRQPQHVTASHYSVTCVTCHMVLIAFSHAEGDPAQMANWIGVHRLFSKHDGHTITTAKNTVEAKIK